MGKLLSIFNYDKAKTTTDYSYLVFDTQAVDENLLCISPQVMCLGENLYVALLTPTLSYWKKEGTKKSQHPHQLIHQAMERYLPDNQLKVFCHHPFQGLLLFNHLIQSGARGGHEASSLFAKKMYKNLSWDLWSQTALQMDQVLTTEDLLVSERKSFKTHLRQFERFIARLNLQHLGDLQEAQFYEIQRRFNAFMGLLWKWTFIEEETSDSDAELTLFNYQQHQGLLDFPWVHHSPFDPVSLKTQLEYAVSLWPQVKEFLIHDLERLKNFKTLQDPYKISQLNWSLVLFDMTVVETEIYFKYPLSYEQDRKDEFKLLLSQFLIGFEKIGHNFKEHAKDTDLDNVPLVMGWDISVKKIVKIQSQNLNLFSESYEQDKRVQNTVNLQSKIDHHINVFRIAKVHIPALDFGVRSVDEVQTEPDYDQKRFQFKPLFIYPEPIKALEKDFTYKKYLERTSSPWWLNQDLKDSYRDYHMCKKTDGHLVWAFQNYKGEWYIHGLYS